MTTNPTGVIGRSSHMSGTAHTDILPDPPKSHDMRQRKQFYRIDSALIPYYADRGDVLVCGEGYLRHEAGNSSERFAPDCVVAFGVDPEAIIGRNGYVISEVGKPPDFVLEVGSLSTGRNDYTIKREGYARYRVLEYWRFDETGGRYHDTALAGDALVDGEYSPITINRDPDGLIWGYSRILGLNVCWDRGCLRFYDPVSGEFLPNAEELKEQRDAERSGRLAAESRASELEAVVERLREQLRRQE